MDVEDDTTNISKKLTREVDKTPLLNFTEEECNL
jgi:hypothetical protein